MRLIDSCITQVQAQGPCTTCNESEVVEEVTWLVTPGATSGAGEPAGISSAEGAGVPLVRDSGSKFVIRVSGSGIRVSGSNFGSGRGDVLQIYPARPSGLRVSDLGFEEEG